MISIRKSPWAALTLALAFVGCDTPAPPSPVAAPGPSEPKGLPADPEKKPVVKEEKAAVKDDKLDDAEIAQVKKLPAEADQTLAIGQKSCPISGEHLGSMGVPIKLTLDEKPVFVCCKGCVKDAQADPKGTLAKLGKK